MTHPDSPSGSPLWAGCRRVLPAIRKHPESVVLLLHGYGSNADDLITLAPELADQLPGTAFISPNAPFVCEMSALGRQWFSLQDFSPLNRWKGVREAAPFVLQMIADLQKEFSLPLSRIALAGFSQGGMLALHVGPRLPEPLAAVVSFSGMLVGAEYLPAEVTARPPVLLVHGQMDPVVPFASLPLAETALKTCGFQVETEICPFMPHSIDEAGLQHARRFLATALQPSGI
jgi:phospholipase/carboxylesterase